MASLPKHLDGASASGLLPEAGEELSGFKKFILRGCVSKIPEAARRCPVCTAQLAPPSEAVVAAMRRAVDPPGQAPNPTADRSPHPHFD